MLSRCRCAIVASFLGASGTAFAASPETPMDRAEFAQLAPNLRDRGEARMKDGQSVHGILETMLLNKVSSDFASGRIVATDVQRGEFVVQNSAGQIKAFPFDVATLSIRN